MALLALAFAWTYRTGEAFANQQPIPLKNLQCPLKLTYPAIYNKKKLPQFYYGLDHKSALS